MFVSFIGLVLASTISATVIDIQVGDNNGSLVFSPEAVVSFNYHNLPITGHRPSLRRLQFLETKLFITSTPRITLSPSRRLPALVPSRRVVLALVCEYI